MEMTIFHQHPWVKWAIGGFGVLLLIILMRRGGSSATVVSGSGGTSDSVQIATIQANAQANTAEMALQASKDQNNAQLAVAQLAASLQGHNSDNELTATLAQIEASVGLGMHQLDTQYHLAELGAATTQQANSLAASVQTHLADTAAGVQNNIVNTNAATQGSLIDLLKGMLTPAPVTVVNNPPPVVNTPPPAPKPQFGSMADAILAASPNIVSDYQKWANDPTGKGQREFAKLGVTSVQDLALWDYRQGLVGAPDPSTYAH